MFGASWLSTKRRGSDRIEYSVSLLYRIGFGAIAVLLLAALASVSQRLLDRSNIVAYVLFAGSVAAALYDERWLFSPESVDYRVGIVGLARNRHWPIAEVRCLRLVESRQSMGRSVVSLSMSLVDGSSFRIDMARGLAGDRLREVAREISRLSGITIES